MGLFTHWWELAIVLVIVLLIFGAGKLPEVGKSFGKSIKEFKNEITDAPPANRVETVEPAQTITAAPNSTTVVSSAEEPEVLVKRTTRTLEDGSQEVVEERVVRRKVSN